MVKGKRIAVVVPAYNEGNLISKVITTMPDFVDAMIIINDCSTDETPELIKQHMETEKRIIMLNHEVNKGLGQTLIDGYVKARELGYDVTAVMAGDAQMAPEDLMDVVLPIVEKRADYVKGYRLLYDNVANIMPKYRYIGNAVLSLLTKFATGYWNIIDPQCGYTAISLEAISNIPIEEMTKGYGYNADILNMLNLAGYKVLDVPVKPVYGEEKSKIKLVKYIFKVSGLLIRLFCKRLWKKYVVRDFHPLVLFYIMSFTCNLFITIPMLIRFIYRYFALADLAKTTALVCFISFFMNSQFFLFAMWMDMQDNTKLIPQERR